MANSRTSQRDEADVSIDRDFSLGGLNNDDTLIAATMVAWTSEAKHTTPLGECIEFVGRLFLKGKWGNKTRHCTCDGRMGNGKNIAVRVHPAD